MKPIELLVPTRFDKIEAILIRISNASLFVIEPDPFRRPTAQKANFRILNRQSDSQRPKLVCYLELNRKKENITTLKISQPDSAQQETLPETGAPFTRFISLLSQHLFSKA